MPKPVARGLPAEVMFVLAKVAHATGYAFLTVLAAFLPVRRPYFWMVIVGLAIHAVGTEIGQTFVPNRSGSRRDVLIDWVGIALGLGFWFLVLERRSKGRNDTTV